MPLSENEKPANVKSKKDYVRKQKQSRNHHCHWPGCQAQVPPAMWGCYRHWMKLPGWLRAKVWAAYQPGQEEFLTGGTVRVSREYLEVAQEVQDWIRENYDVD